MRKGTRYPSQKKAARRRHGRTSLLALGAAFAATGTMGVAVADALPAQGVTRGGPSAADASSGLEDTRLLEFSIPAGPLEVVLAQFERVTGVKADVADPGILVIQSPGVTGRHTVEQALQQLLSGTSVRAASVDATRVRLEVRGVSEFVEVSGGPTQPASPKYTQPLRDTPATVVVIPQAVFEQQGATTLRDALRNTPGITLTAGEGGTAPGDNLLIRGFSARNDIYIDGARDPGVVSRDTFNTESVEVAKGPSSVVAGRGSTGGSVNLVTKTANLKNSTSLRLGGGTADYKRVTADFNRKLTDTMAVRLNVMGQDSGVPRRDDVMQKGWGIAPSFAVGLGTPTQLTVNYQHLQQNNTPDYGLPGTLPTLAADAGETVDDLDFSNFYGLVSRDHEKVKSDTATVTVQHKFESLFTLRNLTRYGRNNLDRVTTPPRAASESNGGADPGFDPTIPQIRRTDTKYQYRDDKTLTNQTDLTARFDTGAVGHTVVTGLELSRDTQPSYSVTDTFANGRPPVTDLFHPDPDQFYSPSLVRTGATSDATATSAGLYAFDTVKLNEQWQADFGLRWDHIDVDYATVAVGGVLGNFTRTDKAFSGRAGLVYKPVERGSIYGAYSTSFVPSFDGSFGLTLSTTGVNSAALPPEKSRNFEVGTKWDLLKNVFLTAAVFRTEKTNAKTTDDSGATVLAGNQRVQGVEFGLSGNITPRWNAFGGLSLMSGKIDDSKVAAEVGRQLPYVPKASLSLWSTYHLPMVRLTVGGGADYTDGYFFSNTNALANANAAAIQALTKYWLFSGVATYEINRHVSLQINALNLANARYVDRGYSGHFVPGAGRALIVSPVVTF